MWWQINMRKYVTSQYKIALALFCIVLTSCGFQLKKASYLPDDMKTLYVTADDKRSSLFYILNRDLKRAKVNIVRSAKIASSDKLIQLHLFKDTLDRRTLNVFQNGQVAQYELTYRVSFSVTRPEREPFESSFELYRNYQGDPDDALAKSQEREILLAELRQLASQRIVRELSHL
jgi:LPS-assembly lipoprotein